MRHDSSGTERFIYSACFGKICIHYSSIEESIYAGKYSNSSDFLAGCVAGILGFSRILRYGLMRWHDFTIAFLTGLMIGAMRKVWPWKVALESQIIRGKEYVIREENVWPMMDGDLVIALLLMSTGFALVLLLEKFSGRSSAN